MADAAALDAALRRHHGGPDSGLLCALHEQAAVIVATQPERRFHLTHAWVYALVEGDAGRVGALEAELARLGGL